jgi:hypothetical protein
MPPKSCRRFGQDSDKIMRLLRAKSRFYLKRSEAIFAPGRAIPSSDHQALPALWAVSKIGILPPQIPGDPGRVDQDSFCNLCVLQSVCDFLQHRVAGRPTRCNG